jgi:hypothetical protein
LGRAADELIADTCSFFSKTGKAQRGSPGFLFATFAIIFSFKPFQEISLRYFEASNWVSG